MDTAPPAVDTSCRVRETSLLDGLKVGDYFDAGDGEVFKVVGMTNDRPELRELTPEEYRRYFKLPDEIPPELKL